VNFKGRERLELADSSGFPTFAESCLWKCEAVRANGGLRASSRTHTIGQLQRYGKAADSSHTMALSRRSGRSTNQRDGVRREAPPRSVRVERLGQGARRFNDGGGIVAAGPQRNKVLFARAFAKTAAHNAHAIRSWRYVQARTIGKKGTGRSNCHPPRRKLNGTLNDMRPGTIIGRRLDICRLDLNLNASVRRCVHSDQERSRLESMLTVSVSDIFRVRRRDRVIQQLILMGVNVYAKGRHTTENDNE
jgi:hypothetical protein